MLGNPDYFNIEEMKLAGMWPLDHLSAFGMVPYLKRLPQDLVGLEVGTYKGENVYTLIEMLPNLSKIYTVDSFKPHTYYGTPRTEEDVENYERVAKENLSRFGDKVEIIKRDMFEAVEQFEDNFFDFILLDANPTYEDVKKALYCYYPKLKSGGHMFVHDCNLVEVMDALIHYKSETKNRIPVHTSKNLINFWVKV